MPTTHPERQRFSRDEARELRAQGLSYAAIGRRLGVQPMSIHKALGRQARGTRFCDWCGNDIGPLAHRFCSEECCYYAREAKDAGGAWATRIVDRKTCKWCGRYFDVAFSRRLHVRWYCSEECLSQVRSSREGRRRQRLPRLANCDQCGAAFHTIYPRQRFCSARCLKDARIIALTGRPPANPVRFCAFEGCDNDFRGYAGQIYCVSPECSAARAKVRDKRVAKDAGTARARGVAARPEYMTREREIARLAQQQEAEDKPFEGDYRSVSMDAMFSDDGGSLHDLLSTDEDVA